MRDSSQKLLLLSVQQTIRELQQAEAMIAAAQCRDGMQCALASVGRLLSQWFTPSTHASPQSAQSQFCSTIRPAPKTSTPKVKTMRRTTGAMPAAPGPGAAT